MTTEKTAAEVELDALVDRLTAEGRVVVYGLARYDGAGDAARFSVRVSVPVGADPDPVVLGAVRQDYDETRGVSEEAAAAMERLHADGWRGVLLGYTPLPADGDVAGPLALEPTAATDFISRPGPGPSTAHVHLDVVREVVVAWSNTRHAAQLAWSTVDG